MRLDVEEELRMSTLSPYSKYRRANNQNEIKTITTSYLLSLGIGPAPGVRLNG